MISKISKLIMRKGLSPVVIVLVIVAAIGGYLVYQNQNRFSLPIQPSITPSDKTVYTEATRSANWKIYEDKTHGFYLKYPEDWVPDEYTKTIVDFVEPKSGPVRKRISIMVYKNAGNLSAEQFLDQIYYKDYEKNFKDTYMKTASFKPVSVDGVSATQLELSAAHGSRGTAVWITKGNIGILLNSAPVMEGEEILNQILSTFKFLEQN